MRGFRRLSVLCRGAESLHKRIEENHIDWVVCTHPFGGLMMTAAKQRYDLAVKTAFIVTD